MLLAWCLSEPCHKSVLVDKDMAGGFSDSKPRSALANVPKSFRGRSRYSRQHQATLEAGHDQGLMRRAGREPMLASSLRLVSRHQRHEDV
jgi:hypothetical protein